MRKALVSGLVVAAVALGVGSHISRASSFNPDPVFPVGAISETASHQIAKLDHVASTLAGRHATVNCWSKQGWKRLQAWNGAHHDTRAVDASGITWFRDHHIELSPFMCEVLQQTLARSANQPLFESFAVTVFAHESAHASGIRVEGLAECRALETEPRAAVLLGLSQAEGRRFRHIYRGTVYPFEPQIYRTPVCETGTPGLLVPDALGSVAALRPLHHTAAAVVRTLPGWKNIEGTDAVGPLSPCSPIADRRLEVARYGIGLLGPSGSFADFHSVQLGTTQAFASAVSRFRAEPGCDLALLRKEIHETHISASVTEAPMPKAITQLSSKVHAFRQIWTEHGERWNRDTIFVFDRAHRELPLLFFRAQLGKLPVSTEVRAVKEVLRG